LDDGDAENISKAPYGSAKHGKRIKLGRSLVDVDEETYCPNPKA